LVPVACSKSGEAEVTPAEDLMQEHGVLERVLLIYEEAARRIGQGSALEAPLVVRAAGIVKSFVEDYHEHNEEKFVFPRLEAAQREAQLVATLRLQHQRGRALTAQIASLAGRGVSAELVAAMAAFGRMYRPHAAREDTVLFPAFREVIGAGAYRDLGEQLEEDEHKRLGEHGFEKVVADVASIEHELGIDDLSRVTPA
jgi:hemerythrin-like domain-containing protein